MLTVQTLRSRPARFRSFTGVSVEQFDQLVLDVTPRYAAAEARRLFRPNRQRHIGAGRKFSRPLSERLLLWGTGREGWWGVQVDDEANDITGFRETVGPITASACAARTGTLPSTEVSR